ncbi:WXG100 family type VII secretion target, partial [Streptosporangium algeriense]
LSGAGAGTGGMGGMPMMPMTGGGAGGEQDKEREKSTWMSEDEGVWGGDEDIAPPVIGQE